MEDVLRVLATESPSLVVVLAIAWMFLRALRSITGDFANASREHTEEMKNFREVIGVNSKIIEQSQALMLSLESRKTK